MPKTRRSRTYADFVHVGKLIMCHRVMKKSDLPTNPSAPRSNAISAALSSAAASSLAGAGAAGVLVSTVEGAAGAAAAAAPESSAAATFRFLRRFFCAFRAVADTMDCLAAMMRGTTGEEGTKASVPVDERAAAARAHRNRHEDTLGLVMICKSIYFRFSLEMRQNILRIVPDCQWGAGVDSR